MKDKKIVQILLFPITVLYYAILGVRVITVDLFIYLYNRLNWEITVEKDNTLDKEDNKYMYEKTKGKAKKNKIYKYSKSTLKKLEISKAKLILDLQSSGSVRSNLPNTYLYKVKNKKNGKITTGTIKGYSKLDVNTFLLNEGFEVYDIKSSKLIDVLYKDSSILGTKMTTKELIFWCTQLATYLKAGLTLTEAIKILSGQMSKNKDKSRAIQAIGYELSLGESFSASLEKQGNLFPPLLINMVKAAEASGTLEETMEDMANYYTEINTTKKQMINAITYPIIILFFSVVVIIFILLYVVPQFENIYAQSGAEVTGVTKVIMNLSYFLKNNIFSLLFVIILIITLLVLLIKKVKTIRASFQMLLMRLPVIKDVIIFNELTIFSKTFASLLKNNVFITDSVDILSKITRNEVYKAILFKTIDNIIAGDKISDAFKDHWAVPDVAYYMIVTGESTGDLANMMQKVSDYYQEMHKSVVNNLKTFLEPVLISFLALVVGTIVVSVIVPMFDLYNSIS